MRGNILVVDDEIGIREFLYELFKTDYNVYIAENGKKAIEIISNEVIDVALLDMRMPGISGLDVQAYIRNNNYRIISIFITADRDVDHAVEAMKIGAFDYVIKPVDYKKLEILVRNAIEKKALEDKVDILEKEIKSNFAFSNIIGQSSKKMKLVFASVKNVLDNDATVLINGESGTGKELIAKAIHYNGNRAKKPFIPIDCAAIPESLIETELFGYEKGAFTGAAKMTRGKFELADTGTLFLDEISNISLEVQAKLLRVIQEKEFVRVGGEKKISVDVRIISASNKDLKLMISKTEFREDLYYRLNVIPIDIPPLRERTEDLPELISFFIDKYNKQYRKSISLDSKMLKLLMHYNWPGNVRELENMINRLVLIATDNKIGIEDLPDEIQKNYNIRQQSDIVNDDTMSLEELEKIYISSLLEKQSYNISSVANTLGITRKTLYSKMEKFGIRSRR